MSFRNLLTSAVKTAFDATGDMPVNVEYTCVATAHDPDTATTVKQEVAYEVEMFITKYKKMELLEGEIGDIRATDFKGIMRQAELPVTPTTDDIVCYKEPGKAIETRYKIMDINKDPVDVIWIIQLRAG